jgi:hypothetical protein
MDRRWIGGNRDATRYWFEALIAIQSIKTALNVVLKSKNNTTYCDFGYLGFLKQFAGVGSYAIDGARWLAILGTR